MLSIDSLARKLKQQLRIVRQTEEEQKKPSKIARKQYNFFP
jgi:hypothetical protein